MLRFDIVEYYGGRESGWEGPEMALNGIIHILYVVDMLYDTIISENWGIWDGKNLRVELDISQLFAKNLDTIIE